MICVYHRYFNFLLLCPYCVTFYRINGENINAIAIEQYALVLGSTPIPIMVGLLEKVLDKVITS